MIASFFLAVVLGAEPSADTARMILVVGAAGEPQYAEPFHEWASTWRAAADTGGVGLTWLGPQGEDDRDEAAEAASAEGPSAKDATTDRDRLKAAIGTWRASGTSTAWLVLIGHGTYDGHDAKFNLRGPDVASEDLAAWLADIERPIVIVDASSSSAPFLSALSHEGRIVITATKSGYEQNFARFGEYMAAAVADPSSDLDKDGQTSVLEAFLTASRLTAEYYKGESRLATEAALIDDNGDARGTPADWFRGARAVKKAQGGALLDGVRAHQVHLVPSDNERRLPESLRRRRDEIELTLARLRENRGAESDERYLARIEPLLIELALLYEAMEVEADKAVPPASAAASGK